MRNHSLALALAVVCFLVSRLGAQAPPPPPLGTMEVLGGSDTADGGARILRGGFPLALEEAIRNPNDLELIDLRTGRARASTIIPQSRWGAAGDATAPLRWVKVSTTGRPGDRLAIRRRPAEARRVRALSMRRDEDSWTVTTPELSLVVGSGTSLLRSLEGRSPDPSAPASIRSGPGFALIVTGEDDKPVSVSPWHVVRFAADETTLEVAATATFLDLRAEIRLRAAAGSPELLVDFRLLNPGEYGWGKAAAATRYLRRVALTLPLPADLEAAAVEETRVERPDLARGLFLLQGHRVRIEGRKRREELKREVWSRGRALAADPSAAGSMRFHAGGKTLDVLVENFRELAPKTLGTDGRSAVFDFLPAGGSGPAFRGRYGRPDKGDPDPRAQRAYRIEGGRAHSVRLRLTLGASTETPLRDAGRLFLVASRDRIAATGALGLPLPAPRGDDSALARFERLLELFVSDRVADEVAGLGRIGLPAFRARGGTYGNQVFHGWFNWGDLPWGDGYCSLHYDLPHSVLLAGLRRGDVRFFELGEDMARHRRDVDQDHGFEASYRGRGGQFYEKGFWHGNFESPKLSHTWLRGPILHWWLTGDPWSKEAAELGRAFIRRQDLAKWNGRYGARVPGWTIDNLVALWEAFGDPRDLALARKIAQRVEGFEKERGFIVNAAARPAAWKPWMHAILAIGIGRLRPHAPEIGPLHDRLLDALEQKALVDVGTTPALFRHHDGEKGRDPSVHLVWPALAAWAGAPNDSNGDRARRARAAEAFRRIVFRHQGRDRNPISFRLEGFPGSESKVMSNIALYGQAALALFPPAASPR